MELDTSDCEALEIVVEHNFLVDPIPIEPFSFAKSNAEFSLNFKNFLRFAKFSVSLKDATPFEVYRALGETVMSFIAKDWHKTSCKST